MADTAPVTAEDLRERLTSVVTRWALMYPLGNWGIWGTAAGASRDQLAQIAEDIAAGWGRDIADRVMAELAGDRGDLRERMAEAVRRHDIDENRMDWWNEQDSYCVCGEQVKDWDEHGIAVAWAEVSPVLERLREQVAELRELQVGLKSLTTEDGAIDMSLHMAHDMMRACVAGFVKILNEEPAPNYVEMRFSLRDDPDVYTVTIQRPGGKTPGEVADEWKSRAQQAEERLAERQAKIDTGR